MAFAAGTVDDLVREYLSFRGFTSSLKQFDADCKTEREKGFRVDRIVEQLCAYVSAFDLNALLAMWQHLNDRVFSNLSHAQVLHGRRLENDFLKLYLANCVQNDKRDKVDGFFQRLGAKLHESDDWREWFALPFVANANEHFSYKLYFTKQWQETYLVTLHNFLSLAFHQMRVPALLACAAERRQQGAAARAASSGALLRSVPSDLVASADVLDDFAIIARAPTTTTTTQAGTKARIGAALRRRFGRRDKEQSFSSQ